MFSFRANICIPLGISLFPRLLYPAVVGGYSFLVKLSCDSFVIEYYQKNITFSLKCWYFCDSKWIARKFSKFSEIRPVIPDLKQRTNLSFFLLFYVGVSKFYTKFTKSSGAVIEINKFTCKKVKDKNGAIKSVIKKIITKYFCSNFFIHSKNIQPGKLFFGTGKCNNNIKNTWIFVENLTVI